MCREFEQGHPGVHLVQRVEPETVPLPTELRTTVFRLVQEALNNVSRHSGATKVVIILRREGVRLTLRVGDNGRGFHAFAEHPGLGLHNFQNRSSYAGGTYTLYTRPETGCALHFTFPLKRG
jgi:signal transduction histidine kinase